MSIIKNNKVYLSEFTEEEKTQIILYHKALTTKFILPLMGTGCALFYICYFSWTPSKVTIGILGIITIALNILTTQHIKNISIFNKKISTRSDLFDTIRWCINIILIDASLMLLFKPSIPAFLTIWTIILLASQSDTFNSSNRNLIFIVGYTTGTILLQYLAKDATFFEKIFYLFGMGSIPIIHRLGENYWIKEISKRKKAEIQQYQSTINEQKSLAALEKVRSDAILGENLKFISHEIGNLLFVLDGLAYSITDPEFKKCHNETISQLKRIVNLVLNDLSSSHKATIRIYNLDSFLQDIETIIGAMVRSSGIEFKIENKTNNYEFQERSGSLFCIIYNLIKNSRDSLLSHPIQREITLSTVILANGRAQITVKDNGPGISPELVTKINLGQGYSKDKIDGHGIGLRFVISECRKNNMNFHISSKVNIGSEAVITLPIGSNHGN